MRVFSPLVALLCLPACTQSRNIFMPDHRPVPPPQESKVLKDLVDISHIDPGLPTPIPTSVDKKPPVVVEIPNAEWTVVPKGVKWKKDGFILSPYVTGKVIDVFGIKPGTVVGDPWAPGKTVIVP